MFPVSDLLRLQLGDPKLIPVKSVCFNSAGVLTGTCVLV